MATDEPVSIIKGWRQRVSSFNFLVFVVAVAAFTDGFIYGMILPVIPDILRDRIHVAPGEVQLWTSMMLAIFGLAFLITPPFVGFYVDSSASKRTPFLVGLAVVAASTLAFFLATSLPVIIIGRALQGFSCSMVFTSGLALIAHRNKSNGKGTALGYVGLGSSIGDLGGPLVGGFLYQHGGHMAMFAVAMGIVAVDFVLRLLTIEELPLPEQQSLFGEENHISTQSSSAADTLGAYAAASSTPIVTAGPSEQSVSRKPSIVEKARSTFVILLSQSRIWAAVIGLSLAATIRTAFGATLTIYLETHFNWDSSISGCVFFVLMIPTFFAPVFGRICDTYGSRLVGTTGAVGASLLLTALGFATASTPIVKVVFVMLLFGVGVCIPTIFNSQNLAVLNIAEEMRGQGLGDSAGQALATGMVGWAVGMLLGPTMAAFLMTRFGWEGLCWGFAILSALGAVVLFLYSYRPMEKSGE